MKRRFHLYFFRCSLKLSLSIIAGRTWHKAVELRLKPRIIHVPVFIIGSIFPQVLSILVLATKALLRGLNLRSGTGVHEEAAFSGISSLGCLKALRRSNEAAKPLSFHAACLITHVYFCFEMDGQLVLLWLRRDLQRVMKVKFQPQFVSLKAFGIPCKVKLVFIKVLLVLIPVLRWNNIQFQSSLIGMSQICNWSHILRESDKRITILRYRDYFGRAIAAALHYLLI